ncbi:unnamed protein product [Scytosiphon promiscuus]
MRKRVNMHRLGRDMSHRLAMLRNMVTSFIYHERIRTTVPRAKELRKLADNMVTLAKKGTPHHQRQAQAVVRENGAVVKLFEVLGPRYMERPGGYTRVMKLQKPRKGDQADMAIIEFVDREGELRPAKPVGESQSRGLLDLVEGDFLPKEGQKESGMP